MTRYPSEFKKTKKIVYAHLQAKFFIYSLLFLLYAAAST